MYFKISALICTKFMFQQYKMVKISPPPTLRAYPCLTISLSSFGGSALIQGQQARLSRVDGQPQPRGHRINISSRSRCVFTLAYA